MSKESLQKYLQKHGELQTLEDLANVFHELGSEWIKVDNKAVGYAFSSASISIANIYEELKNAEEKYLASINLSEPLSQRERLEKEFKELTLFFNNLSPAKLTALLFSGDTDTLKKINRLKFLFKFFKNEKPK